MGWRQNEQTYDALTFSTQAISKTNLSYSYVGNVRRIFGDGVPAGSNNVDTHLLNAKIADQRQLVGDALLLSHR